jgi:hypothetical protein
MTNANFDIASALDRANELFSEAHSDGWWDGLGMDEQGDVNAQAQFGELVVRAYSDRDHALYRDGARWTAVGNVNGLVGFQF